MHPDDVTSCKVLLNGSVTEVVQLKCFHEEADDRMMYHINHATSVHNITNVVIASQDTDVLVSAIYHFKNTFAAQLREMWIISGKSGAYIVVPLHILSERISPDVIKVLPAIHALSGCDSTSKVGGTKKAVLKTILQYDCNKLIAFGKSPLTDEMIAHAELFLLRCLSKKEDIGTFDALRSMIYHTNSQQLNLEKLPCTSNSLTLHIKRAYFQCYLWYYSPIEMRFDIDPVDYGYKISDTVSEAENDYVLEPVVTNVNILPEDFSQPCSCNKCASEKVCPCRIRNIACCKYCKCTSCCRNPYNPDM